MNPWFIALIVLAIIVYAMLLSATNTARKTFLLAQSAYQTMRHDCKLKMALVERKADRAAKVGELFSEILIDLAHCGSVDELNWKLHHIRCVEDSMMVNGWLNNEGLYESIINMLSKELPENQRAWLAIIEEQLKTYYALSDADAVEISTVLNILTHLEMNTRLIENDIAETYEKLKQYAESVGTAIRLLNLSEVVVKDNSQTGHTSTTFEDLLAAQMRMTDAIVVPDDDENEEESDNGEDETETVQCDTGSDEDEILRKGDPVHGEEAKRSSADVKTAPGSDVIVIQRDDDQDEIRG